MNTLRRDEVFADPGDRRHYLALREEAVSRLKKRGTRRPSDGQIYHEAWSVGLREVTFYLVSMVR